MRPPRGSGFRGRGGFGGGRGGGRGGGSYGRDEGPPAEVVEAGEFLHECEGEAVCRLTNDKVPYFNGPIYLQNKTQVGKVDEILGPINKAYFTIKMDAGVIASSYSAGDKFYISTEKLLPLERFLPRPKGAVSGGRGGSRGGRGGGRGGGGGGRGGRGTPRGGRGGFRGRGGGGGFRGASPRGRGGFRGRGRA